MQVVGQEEDRCGGGGVGDQVEDREPDQEDVGHLCLVLAECGPQGRPLRRGQVGDPRAERTEHPLQAGVGDAALGTGVGSPQHPKAHLLGEGGGFGQERGLADARCAADQQRAPAGLGLGEHAAQERELLDPADELHVPPSGRPHGGAAPERQRYCVARGDFEGRRVRRLVSCA